jgi:hypothetical protein
MIHLKLEYQDRRLYWTARASSPPTLLCVNREARLEALKQYDQPFHKGSMIPFLICRSGRSLEDLLVNWVDDLIYVDIPKNLHAIYGYWRPRLTFETLFYCLFTKSTVLEGRIRKLALNDTTLTWRHIGPRSRGPGKFIKWENEVFKQVQELVVVVTERYCNHSSLQVVLKDNNTSSEWKERIQAQFTAITERRQDWKGPVINTIRGRQLPMRKRIKKRKV